MAFNVQGARAAGYSDAEIADHLAGQAKFDTAAARAAGYSDIEILNHLAPPMVTDAEMAPFRAAARAVDNAAMTHVAPTPPPPSAKWGDVIAALPRQAKGAAFDVMAGMNRDVIARLQRTDPVNPALAARMAEAEGVQREARADTAQVPDSNWVQRGVQGAASSSPHLAVPAMVAALTRNPSAAALSMYPSTRSQKYWELKDLGQSETQAQLHAAGQGAIEVATEFPAFSFLAKAGSGPIKQLVGFLLRDLPGESVAELSQGTDDYVAAAQRTGQPVTPELVAAGLAEAATRLPETWVATAILGAVQAGPSIAAQEAERRTPSLDPSAVAPVATRGVAASGAPLAPQSTMPDTRTPEIPPEQYFIGNRLVPGTGGFLNGRYDLAAPPVPEPSVAEPEPWDAPAAPVSALERLKSDPDLRTSFEQLKHETGWDTVGGQALGQEKVGTDFRKVEGRTPWLPRYPWFKDKPDYANEAMIQKVITKTLVGKKLGSREQQLATWLAEVAADRIKAEPFLPTADELSGSGFESNLGDAHEAALVTRAVEIDEAAVERAAVQYGDDREGFLRAIRDLLDADARPRPASAQAQSRPAINRDLFAGSDAESESLARRNAVEQERLRQEAARTGDVSVETGDPTDLFSQARQQTDLTDQAPQRNERGLLPGTGFVPADQANRERLLGEGGPDLGPIGGPALYNLPAEQRTALLKIAKVRSVDAFEDLAISDRRAAIEKWRAVKPAPELTTYEKAEKFHGKQAGIDAARQTLAGITLGRNFGESMEDFLARDASARRMYERAQQFIDERTGSEPQPKPEAGDSPSAMSSGGVARSWAPGVAWTPSYQIQGQPNVGAPVVPQTITIGTRAGDERALNVPEKPIRREHIMAEFQRAFGMKVYQGKPFRLRKALGFFDPKSFEVRVKAHNDLEVTAHEVFHWLDRTFPSIRALYHRPQFRDQLKSVSYDQKQVLEGFAEFGRLFLTQEPQAAQRTPEFYDAFVTETKRLGIYPKLRRVQDRMHQWYAQGAELRAQSKIGKAPPPPRDRVEAFRQGLLDRSQSRIMDYLHRAKMIEQETTGSVAQDATQSLYKELRLLDHSRSVIHAFLNYGTAEWTPRGDLQFNGKGLRQIFEPVADVWDDALAYFVGRRAAELRKYGKERLFTPDEIQALLNKGLQSPKAKEIQAAFDEYQRFNERLLDFAVQSGIVSTETRNIWLKMYNAYVPFYRVRDTLASGVPGQRGGLFKRLTGGTENLADTWDNIVRNAEMTVEASLRNVAKRKLYQGIARAPVGQKYAVAIPAGQKPVNIGMTQIESALGQLIKDAQAKANDPNAKPGDQAHWAQVAMALDLLSGASNMGNSGGELNTLADQATFFLRGQKPAITDKDFYLSGGKPVWFQIGDQELMRMLEAINSYRPLHIVERAFGTAARVLRRGVTLAPEFQIRNFLRDQMNAATLSQGGQKPFIDGLAAAKDVLTNDEILKSFFLNGGGFGLQQAEAGQAMKLELERVRKANGEVNIHAILDTPAKVFEWYDKATQASELATRVAEFKKITEAGGSRREGAYQANEVSTDFAAHGSDPALAFVRLSVPFFGARLQGLGRLGREMHEHPVRLASRALLMVTLPSLLLYWRNKDDERYKALTPETKALYWVLLDPRGDGVWLIPKPFEVGALFGTVPEVAWDQFENGNDKKTVEALRFMLTQTFSFNPIPQALKPPLDLARNKDFRGSPIVPEGIKDVDPSEQFTAYTAPSMRQVGDLFGVSPVKLEYLLRGYLGTLGTYAVAAADVLVKPDPGVGVDPTKPASQQPIARAFRRSEPYRSTSYEQDFYDMLEQSRRVVATANHMRNTLRISDQAAYLEENESLYGRNKALNRIKAKVDKINESMKIVRFEPSLSADEKRQQLDAMQQEKNTLLRDATTDLQGISP